VFNYIQDKVWKKLKGWKEKNLSFAGRGTLIKVVAQAIPTYLMSCFLLPKGLCNQLDIMISKFWWGSTTDRRKIHWVNWKKTCKQKKMGGMGFRDLGVFNEALLAKQGWRIMTEPTSLMATVLKAKYFPNDHFLKAKQGYIPSYVWQCISRASWVLKKGCIWLVGNGNNINIWEDRWIHQQVGTKIWTPKPNNTSLHLVKDLIKPHSNEWNEDIIKQNFFPIEAELICQIPTINSEGEDLISWQGTKEGNYTVRSGYNAIMEWHQADSNQAKHTSSKDDPINWNNIWKVANPPKQIHLMWRILNNALPVKSNLILRGMVCDSLCPRCHNGPETIDHVFLNCDQARQVWFSSPLTITTSSSKFQSYRVWFNYMLTNTTKDCIQIIVTITYSIWLARNKKIFQNKDIPVSETVEKAIKVL
jgi:hypothetical protein